MVIHIGKPSLLYEQQGYFIAVTSEVYNISVIITVQICDFLKIFQDVGALPVMG